MVELAYKFDENSYLEKVSRSLKYDSIFLYIYNIWTPTPITLPCSLARADNYGGLYKKVR